jgi:nucleoside-diphosphate-sugar epimerase
MKYLITGSGYLAKHLISALLEKPEIEKIKIFSRAERAVGSKNTF